MPMMRVVVPRRLLAALLVLPFLLVLGSSAQANPFAHARLFVDPGSHAARQAREWEAARPADAAALRRIAARSHADWFGDWNRDVRADVAARVAQVRAAGALPVLVAYDIPLRDCSGHSSGGAPSPAAYRAWIRDFAAGIGRGRAAVVLEPDALAGLDCLARRDRRMRVRLLRHAVRVLTRGSRGRRVAVYIDAGNETWHPPGVMARRLRAAGVRRARGFSLNVSNFHATAGEVAYGRAIARRIGRKRFVVDTSRNGNGSDGAWCNPPGRALGHAPTGQTGHRLVDAYLWVKPPGESDGTCNGGPPAGTWWPEYALGLATG